MGGGWGTSLEMSLVPTDLQLDLFRAVEDVHELTSALAVLLVDADGRSVAASGDEDHIPPPVRRVLGGRALAAAGSVRELLTPIAEELVGSPVNVTIVQVEGGHALAIAFDSSADLTIVQAVASEAGEALGEMLRAAAPREE
jgi:hypothetical protein